MVMKPIFEIQLEGRLDQPRLDHFTRLLNLSPRGRLTDTEDFEFGHRALRDTVDEYVWLKLWRRHDDGWAVRLTFAGPPPPQPVVSLCMGQVLGAAGALGLEVSRIWPPPAEPVPVPIQLELPRQGLAIRLTGGDRIVGRLRSPGRHALQRVLGLRRQFGGLSGKEFGWRYVRWDPQGGSLLLQLYDSPDDGAPGGGTVVALLCDGRWPPVDVLTGCALQVWVAAAEAGMTLAPFAGEPHPHDDDEWEALARYAAVATSLRAVFRLVGCVDGTLDELTRGKLLMITRRPEWRAAPPRLQRDVRDFLLGLAKDLA